jgi:hypothetical protein
VTTSAARARRAYVGALSGARSVSGNEERALF